MKKIHAVLFCLLLPAIFFCAYAQMSESEIISFVQEKASQGMDKTGIASELVSKGVSLQQIQSLYAKYSKSGFSSMTAEKNIKDGETRIRTANGEKPLDREQPYQTIHEPAFPLFDKDKKEIFGHRMFRSSELSFEPDMNIPTPADYVLGAGDEVVIDIYGTSQSSNSYTVSPDGFITVRDIGPISVAGLTVEQAQKEARKTIGKSYLGSSIRLSIGQTRTVTVNIIGEVERPGTYKLSAFSNAYNALYLSGGVGEIGTLRDVQISRGGKTVSHVDVYDFILNGSLEGNIILKDNDVIRVGTYRNLVRIEGQVRRPMWYELKDGETLGNLLSYAGGRTGDAYREVTRVERKCPEGLNVYSISEKDLDSFTMCDGDVVVVEDIVERYRNTVSIEGAVFRPGKYQMGDNVKTVCDLVKISGGLIEKALTSRAVLYRMQEDRSTRAVSVRLRDILEGKADDISLENEDNLVIASTVERDSLRHVTVIGEVYKPGNYDFSYGESVADLVIRAGGLKESASSSHIEVSRRITDSNDNPDGKAMAKVYDIDIEENSENAGSFILKPYDIIAIHRSPDYKEQHTVTIKGEVHYAGSYTLSNKEERISDIISRAGGLTANAFPSGAQLMRLISENQRKLMQLEADIALSNKDSLKIAKEMADTTYLIGIDLVKIMNNPGCSSDIVLQQGDVITVPQMDNTVKITGGVLFPNTVAYEKGKKLSYYINQAGGITKKGRRSQAYIVYANGQVSRASSGYIMPGCQIVVPEKEKNGVNPQNASMWIGLGSTVASIGAVIATILK